MIRDAIIIYRKEMKNLAKDRRTLVFLVLLPLFIMPLILGTIGTVAERQESKSAETVYALAILNNPDPRLQDLLDDYLLTRPAEGVVQTDELLDTDLHRHGDRVA